MESSCCMMSGLLWSVQPEIHFCMPWFLGLPLCWLTAKERKTVLFKGKLPLIYSANSWVLLPRLSFCPFLNYICSLNWSKSKEEIWAGMLVCTCNPSTQETEAGRSWVVGSKILSQINKLNREKFFLVPFLYARPCIGHNDRYWINEKVLPS
jgi:hypothetical protein